MNCIAAELIAYVPTTFMTCGKSALTSRRNILLGKTMFGSKGAIFLKGTLNLKDWLKNVSHGCRSSMKMEPKIEVPYMAGNSITRRIKEFPPVTSDEEFQMVENLIRQEGRTDICFYVGAVRNQYRWEWIEPGLTQNSCLNSEYYKHWLDGGPSYTDVLPDGTEIDETCCELLYKKGEDRFYLNDITSDVPGVYPSFRGRIGYIIEYID